MSQPIELINPKKAIYALQSLDTGSFLTEGPRPFYTHHLGLAELYQAWLIHNTAERWVIRTLPTPLTNRLKRTGFPDVCQTAPL
jgi:hypothetical protein